MKRALGALGVSLLLIGVAACQPARLAGRAAAPTTPVTTAEHTIAADLYTRINQERAARGIPALAWDGGLEARAANWSHTMPSLATPATHLHHSDLNPLLVQYVAAAENIGWTAGGSSGLMHVSLMQSDGHRANILAPNLNVVGIGVYCAPGHVMWVTQEFGRTPGLPGNPAFGPVPPLNPIVDAGTDGPSC